MHEKSPCQLAVFPANVSSTMRCTMKKSVLKVGLASLLAANLLLVGNILPPTEGLVFAAETQKAQVEMHKVKGKITNISQKAKTIALAQKDNSFFLLKFNDDTTLNGVKSTKEFKVGEAIMVDFTTVDGENIASSLQKAIVKLPKGVTEVKTDELAQLIESNKDLVIVDARPAARYGEGHIASAVSIPFSKITKMGDDGSQLLDKYKDKQLVFYCGGPT
ncbi:MAG: putative sulfurtransferase [Desulforhopalus sp.]|jgi:predicted sulfurtransferase